MVQSWGQLEAAKANIEATQAQVQASEIALNGVREEARVGQRTTLDVLNAQQELVNARVALVSAQRDRVVASYHAACRRSGGCRRRCSACVCRSMTPTCTTIRCAIPGPACARPTGAEKSFSSSDSVHSTCRVCVLAVGDTLRSSIVI